MAEMLDGVELDEMDLYLVECRRRQFLESISNEGVNSRQQVGVGF